MTRRWTWLVLVVVLGGLAVACGGDNDISVDTPEGGVNIDQGDDGGITVEGPSGGEVNIGTGEYPEGWPSEFPVPDGASPVYSIGAEGGVSVWFGTDQSADDVKAFFTEALPSAGYTIDSTTDFDDANGSYTVMSVSGNGTTGGIYLGEGAAAAGAGFSGDFDFWVTLSPQA